MEMHRLGPPVFKAEKPYTYIIYKVDSTYYAVNGHTGRIEFRGTVAATVINSVLSAINTLGGGSVILKKGQYDLNATLAVNANTIIAGEGINTILKLENATNVHMISATSKGDITIKDLKIDGNAANQTVAKHGIYLNACSNALLSHLLIVDCKYDGARLLDCAFALITFCEFTGNIVGGVVLEKECTGCKVVSCYSHDNLEQLIHFYAGFGELGTHNQVINCHVHGNDLTASGILMECQDYFTVANCVAHNGGVITTNGIDITHSRYGSVVNCVCYENSSGISVEQNTSTDVSISNCICYNNEYHGIAISADATRVTITGCICVGNVQQGIFLDAGDHHVITGNLCKDQVTYDGMIVNGCTECIISCNSFHGNNRYGIQVYGGANYNIYIGNNARGNGTDDIVGVGANSISEHNLLAA